MFASEGPDHARRQNIRRNSSWSKTSDESDRPRTVSLTFGIGVDSRFVARPRSASKFQITPKLTRPLVIELFIRCSHKRSPSNYRRRFKGPIRSKYSMFLRGENSRSPQIIFLHNRKQHLPLSLIHHSSGSPWAKS